MEDAGKPAKFTPSKRGKNKKVDEATGSETSPDTASTAASSEFDDEATEAASTTVDDGLPHPRVCSLSLSLRFLLPVLPSLLFVGKIKTSVYLLTGSKILQPFESRRDFFQRTSNEWQEILMTSLRWKNIQPESLTVKEIKTKAFEMSEEKWWDCREEITALEDEQEAAGIGEVVSLADRGEGTSGGAGGHGGPRRR